MLEGIVAINRIEALEERHDREIRVLAIRITQLEEDLEKLRTNS